MQSSSIEEVVRETYLHIIEDVIENIRPEFLTEDWEECSIQLLKDIWKNKLINNIFNNENDVTDTNCELNEYPTVLVEVINPLSTKDCKQGLIVKVPDYFVPNLNSLLNNAVMDAIKDLTPVMATSILQQHINFVLKKNANGSHIPYGDPLNTNYGSKVNESTLVTAEKTD